MAPAALSLPLVLRFPRQPLLCLLCQTITNCLLGPHPTYGDIALWLVSHHCPDGKNHPRP